MDKGYALLIGLLAGIGITIFLFIKLDAQYHQPTTCVVELTGGAPLNETHILRGKIK